MFSVGLHESGLGPVPSQGSQRYCDLHLTEDTQVLKSPEGLTSQVLLQINKAKHSKGIRIHFNSFVFLSFDRNNLFYLCSEFFMVCCFLYDRLGGK